MGWVEPAPGSGPSGDGEAWQSALARLDAESVLVSAKWTFPAETMPPHRLALVHGGYAVLAGDQQVVCYTLAGQHDPVEIRRAEAQGCDLNGQPSASSGMPTA